MRQQMKILRRPSEIRRDVEILERAGYSVENDHTVTTWPTLTGRSPMVCREAYARLSNDIGAYENEEIHFPRELGYSPDAIEATITTLIGRPPARRQRNSNGVWHIQWGEDTEAQLTTWRSGKCLVVVTDEHHHAEEIAQALRTLSQTTYIGDAE